MDRFGCRGKLYQFVNYRKLGTISLFYNPLIINDLNIFIDDLYFYKMRSG